MANFPDVMKPVVINASTQLIIQTAFFLRDVCFISCGDTTLGEGKSATIDLTSVNSIFNDNVDYKNVTYKRLQSFFKYANTKTCIVFELGAIPSTPMTDNYQNLVNFANTLRGPLGETFSEQNFLGWLYEEKYSNSRVKNEVEQAKKFLEGTNYEEEKYQEWLTTEKKTESITTLKEYCLTLQPPIELDKDNVAYINFLAANDTVFKALEVSSNLQEYLSNLDYLDYTNEAYHAWLEANGTTKPEDIEAKIKLLTTTFQEGLLRAYWYVTPDVFRDIESFITLVTNYTSTISQAYFVVSFPTDIDFSVETNLFAKYGGAKSLIPVFDNSTLTTLSAAGGFAGRFASNSFDLSDTNPASPFNYKTMSGWAAYPLSNTRRQELIDNCMNFIGSLAGNTLWMNGRCADGRPIDYWYQWDYCIYEADTALITLLLNGVNNPNYTVKYDQNGIDNLKANVENTLNKMVNWGCITEFAASLDTNTGELVNVGSVTAIPFRTYVTANPQDYNNEVYKGLSFYARIGKYIRQIVMAVTLG